MYRIFLLLTLTLALLTTTGCKKDSVLSERKTEELLYDMHLADAIMEREFQKGSLSDSIRNSMYASVFEKHGVTKAQFDTTISWYGRNLDKYIGIYKRLSARFAEESNTYQKLAEQQTGETIQNDTTTILDGEKRVIFSNFDFPLIRKFKMPLSPDTTADKQYQLKFSTFGINPKMKYFPRVQLSLHYADTTDTKSLTLQNDSTYTLDIPVLKQHTPTGISGFFFVRPYSNYFYRVIFDDISLTDTIAAQQPDR
ncbi:MAG: DUF4296 domain-containing protein [Bacteroidales bacterium]|nr:DUF4296 domain-containing protein [Bacteroidales bacterium]